MSQAVTDRISGATDGGKANALRLSANALSVLQARYLIKDESGTCQETPADLFRRVARAVAAAELQYDSDPRNRSEWEDRFFASMAAGRFMPNSPTLMNAGREMGMLSACFVLPVRDSIDEIFDSIKHTALIQKAGGGTGFAFDELRPTGDYIKSSGGCTSGPISFWRAFSEATNAIQQGAFRRGANMGMMYIDHPDILKFLHAKQDLNQFTNYNISVKITDAFMEAFRAAPDAPHVVCNPRTKKTYYLPRDLDIWSYDIRALVPTTAAGDKDDPARRFYTRRDIWDIIVRHAWETGEPGVVFMDRINADNPTPHVGRIEATNPCGEQPLLPYEACNLGSINLAKFIVQACSPDAHVDWNALRTTIHECTRFLDDVIDVNNYPLPQIDAICKGNRKIGLGVMGFADALFQLGVAYNSDAGVAWGERFMKFLNEEAHAASEELARQRGSFPYWKGSTWDTRHHRPMRNACCTTVAPTGTISILADCSCGIEPLFSLVFYRNVLKGQSEGQKPLLEVNGIFERLMRERGFASTEILDRVATDGTLAHIPEIPDDLKRVFVCAHDVTPVWHVRMQAAFQKHCDASISKTINFPESASVEDVETIYRLSFELRCKGVTVYRNGCRKAQPMALKEKPAAEGEPSDSPAPPLMLETIPAAPPAPPAMEPATLPEILSSVRIRQMTPFGNMHVQITVDPTNERELEVFAQLGKGGDLANSDLEAICRMVSLWLRAGGRLKHVVQQLKGIGSSLQVSTRDGKIMSLGDGLARALTKYTRAKSHFGLQTLLLGNFDQVEMDCVQRGVVPPSPAANGRPNGKGNGNGNGHSCGNGGPPPRMGALGADTTISPRPAAGSLSSRTSGEIEKRPQAEAFKVLCPECQSPLRYGEGCCTCQSCGYSHC